MPKTSQCHIAKKVVKTVIFKRRKCRTRAEKGEKMRTLLSRVTASVDFATKTRTKDCNDNLVVEVTLVLVTVSVYGTEQSPAPTSNIVNRIEMNSKKVKFVFRSSGPACEPGQAKLLLAGGAPG